MEEIAIYKPTQLQAEIILKLAESKGLKFYIETKKDIVDKTFEKSAFCSLFFDKKGNFFCSIPHNEAELECEYEVLSFIEFLGEIESHKANIVVELKNGHEAVISSLGVDFSFNKISNHKISYESFDELVEAVKEYRK